MVVATVCSNQLAITLAALYDSLFISRNFDKVGSLTTITEPLYSIALIAIGFFFGKQSVPKTVTPGGLEPMPTTPAK